MRYEVTIPQWKPTSVNRLLGNPWRASRLKRHDRDLVAAYLVWAAVPVPSDRWKVPPRRVALDITLSPRYRKPPDPDNLWKSTLDALVHARALRDDSARWCQLGPVELARGAELSTTIILEDLEEPG